MCANAEEMSLQLYFTNVGKNMGEKKIYIFSLAIMVMKKVLKNANLNAK